MKTNDPYYVLAKYILPKEFNDYFEVTQVGEECLNGELLLHIYLDERDKAPTGHGKLSPNGFYEESCISDFPIREYHSVLHVRRRRWKDKDGKSVSRDWQLVAEGTRISKEFAAFLKESLGFTPDYSALLDRKSTRLNSSHTS